MKLIRLKINEKFRSLQPGFEVFFLREWNHEKAEEFNPYVLAGPNGSGKSNILEALAAIFYHLDCIYLNTPPASFWFDEDSNLNGFKAEKALPDAFELEYLKGVRLELLRLKLSVNNAIRLSLTLKVIY